MVGSKKPSRITRQKTCCASESNMPVRFVFANQSGFDAPIGVVLAWEERASYLNIFRTTNRDRISETFTNYEAKDLLRKSVDDVLTYSGRNIAFRSQNPSELRGNRLVAQVIQTFVKAWVERGSCLNIFRTTNRGRMLETFMNYEAKDLLRKSVDHVLTYSGRQIPVGYQKPSRITRQKNRCASESNTSVCVLLANRSGFDAPIGVVLAWMECGSCLNIFRTTNRGRISETLTNYEAKDLLRKQKTCCTSESNTSVRVIFVNLSGFDAPIGVVLPWEERVSCLNIFRTTNRGRILETFTNYDANDLLRKNLHELRGKRLVAQVSQTRRFALYLLTGVVLMLQLESCWHGRSVEHVLTYSELQITVGPQKRSRITRQKACCASESNTSVRVVFANRSGFDAPIAVVLAWEERGSCLKLFWTTNRGPDLESNTSSNTSIRVVFANRCGFDAPIGVALAWDERGSCLNIFRTTNRGRISKTFTNYEAKDLLRKSVDHVLTYSGRQIVVGSQKPSRITRQKTCCANESNTSVRVVLANRSGFDPPIGVVLAWEDCESCLNIFRTTNRGRISETFTNYEAKDLLRKTVDHVLTYSGRKIAVGSQKPSRITRQKTCCANESNTSVRIVLANRSGFDPPIGVVLAWEDCGSCLNIFRTTNRGRISETFTNYEAKDLLRKVALAWEERGSCLNIFRTTNRGRMSETFTNYEAKDLMRNRLGMGGAWITFSGRKIAVGSQKPSRITRQKTSCASESNTSVSVVFANRSCFDAPIGVVLAWEDRGSYLNIFRTTNHGRITKTFTNYEAKDLLRKQKTCCASESNTSVRVVLANQTGFDGPIGVVLAWEERGSCLNIFRTTNRGQISETFMNYEAKDSLRIASNTSVCVVFANRSGFDSPIGVVLAWEGRGSCLNIFWTSNHGRISETLMNYEAKDLLRNRLGTGGAWIMS
ncbi:uncharacterized protein G2W53_026242 [Senna tora]|uniref:Uncharacterized protein n=1 Tax=Senna tora TaxID=362788 RepID=A0A834TGJ8_9FABA|nr:uncharacterized protein G2W53_026242 [Senna tora]